MWSFCPICGAGLPANQAGQTVLRCPKCGDVSEPKAGFAQPSPANYPPAPLLPSPGYPPPYVPPLPSSNPYQSPNPWSENFPYQGYAIPDRGRALAKVKGPAILMLVYSGLLSLCGIALGGMMPFILEDMSREEGSVMMAVLGVGTFLCLAAGVFNFWAGWRMMKLRSYAVAMTAVVFSFLIGFLTCLPLMLVGIWPLIILLDSEVRACFDQPETGLPLP